MSVSSADYSASSFYCSEAVNDMMVPSNAEVCDHISPTVSNSEDESSIVNVFDYSASNLSCNESVNDMVFSSNSVVCDHISSSVSDLEDESFIVHMFDSELHQMPVYDSIRRLDKFHEVVTARHNAIKWMFKVHAYYNFNPKTAYLSTNYLDRFLLLHGLPVTKFSIFIFRLRALNLYLGFSIEKN
ncbi:cyclin-D1-1-like [Cornus florida]|uniref:cyclin-D1-1-like n=1 Tax=Cornus florida TaxID=4283 RepID=UPI00289AD2BA|nr:cyclin-D1-1-like [Cornus florida]